MELRAAGERFDAEQGERREEEERPAAELTRLQVEAERLRNERDRLLEEARRWTAVITEQRKKLSEFLLSALDQVEQVSTNGSVPASRQSELNELQETLRNAGPQPPGLVFEAFKIRDPDVSSF